MKRFEVVVTTHSRLLDAISAITHEPNLPHVRQYRWRWRARLACWIVNNSTPQLPFVGGYQTAIWRPILRVVHDTERAA